MQDVEECVIVALTVLSSDTGLRLALAQLAEAGGAAAAGDGGAAPAALLLPQSGAAHRDPLSAGDAAGQAGDAAPPAACYRHLGRAGLLGEGLGGEEGEGRGNYMMGGKVTDRLRKRNTRKEKD